MRITEKEGHEPFTELKRQVLEQMDMSRSVSDEEVLELIDECVLYYGKEKQLSLNECCDLRQELFYSLRRLDILQELLDDPTVTEIMVNGTEGIFLERDGKLLRWDKQFNSTERIQDIIQQMAGACNRVGNEGK